MTDSAPVETFDPNAKLALICVDEMERKAETSAALQELGYRVHLAASGDEASERMRKNAYEVVVLDEAFQGASPHDNPLLAKIQWMPTPIRRYMFVALLGAEFTTLDNMMAFGKRVNAVISYNDLAQMKPILQRALADNDQFYRVFRQVLGEAGER